MKVCWCDKINLTSSGNQPNRLKINHKFIWYFCHMGCQQLHDWFGSLLNTSEWQREKPPHLLLQTWCMHMCQICHLHSAVNPFQREGYYPACQSNAAGEQIFFLCEHVFMDMKGGRRKNPGRQEAVWVCNQFICPHKHVQTHSGTYAWPPTPTVQTWRQVVDISVHAVTTIHLQIKVQLFPKLAFAGRRRVCCVASKVDFSSVFLLWTVDSE